LEAQGGAESSPDNDGTGRHCQTARVRQARRECDTKVHVMSGCADRRAERVSAA
jgi:hypothetical protein